MVLVVVTCLPGFLGRGPFSHRTIVDSARRMAEGYQPGTRSGTTT